MIYLIKKKLFLEKKLLKENKIEIRQHIFPLIKKKLFQLIVKEIIKKFRELRKRKETIPP